MTLQIERNRSRLRGREHRGNDPVPRLDRRFLGRPVLPPQDFHPGLHDRVGLYGQHQGQFDRRNVKIIGLSVDPVEDQAAWSKDIEETQGTAPNYPIIGDKDFKVSKLYGMLRADTERRSARSRTAADNQTVRNVFVIGPDKKIKLILVYPMTAGRNFDRGPASHRLAPADRRSQGRDPGQLAPGRQGDHRRLGLRRRRQGALPRRVGGARSPGCGSCRSPSPSK